MLIYYVFTSNLMLGRIGGLILLFFMGMYLISMLKSVNKEDKVIETKKFEIKDIIYVFYLCHRWPPAACRGCPGA